MFSVTNVRGFLQITEVNLRSSFQTEKIFVPCSSACSNMGISENAARKLKVQGTSWQLTVHGINSHHTLETNTVELKLTPVHSSGSCPVFVVKPYLMKDLNIGTEVIDVES